MLDALHRSVPFKPATLATLIAVGTAASLCLAVTAGAAVQHRVSQKGRAFNPGGISVRSGEAIEFVNDDGDLLHHAYLENDRFSFDTGDQEPGSKSVVAFPVPGRFVVLCGIHPKMKLVVDVK